MEKIELYALPENCGQRIDLFICKAIPSLTRNTIQRLCKEGLVKSKSNILPKNYRVRGNEVFEITLPNPKPLELPPQEIPIDIVYEDDDLLVVNKIRGMVVHPAPGARDGTLVNALLHYCGSEFKGIGGAMRPGIVHRLDKLTSGLLVVAKTSAAYEDLSKQFSLRSCKRIYEAVVHGALKNDSGVISAPIGRHLSDRKKMSVRVDGRKAITLYRTIDTFKSYSHVELELVTGRTHQIRVHMASIGHPVAGDEIYGPRRGIDLGGQCLHARTLGFTHPISGDEVEFTSPLPEYFAKFLEKLQQMV